MVRVMKGVMIALIAAFFALMWGLMMRAHVFGKAVTHTAPDYDRLLAPGEDQRERTMGIYFVGRRFGTSHAVIERHPDGTILIRNKTDLELGESMKDVLGISGALDFSFCARISPLAGLQNLRLTSKKMSLRLLGFPEGEQLRVVGRLGTEEVNMSVPFDRHRAIGDVFSPPAGLPELNAKAVGSTWYCHVLNPVLGRVQRVTGTVDDARVVEMGGRKERVYLLSFRVANSRYEMWVKEDGEVLIQGTPFGLSLRRDDLPRSVLEQLAR